MFYLRKKWRVVEGHDLCQLNNSQRKHLHRGNRLQIKALLSEESWKRFGLLLGQPQWMALTAHLGGHWGWRTKRECSPVDPVQNRSSGNLQLTIAVIQRSIVAALSPDWISNQFSSTLTFCSIISDDAVLCGYITVPTFNNHCEIGLISRCLSSMAQTHHSGLRPTDCCYDPCNRLFNQGWAIESQPTPLAVHWLQHHVRHLLPWSQGQSRLENKDS